MQMPYLCLGLVSTVVLTSCLAYAVETKVKRSDMPPAVEKTVQAQSAGATIKGISTETEHGQTLYEVEMTVNGHSKDISIAKDGTVLDVEEEIAFNSLPASVQSALLKLAKGAKITRVESVTKKGKLVAYEAATIMGAKKGEIAVGPNGEALPRQKD